jgi:hypothetical protein
MRSCWRARPAGWTQWNAGCEIETNRIDRAIEKIKLAMMNINLNENRVYSWRL